MKLSPPLTLAAALLALAPLVSAGVGPPGGGSHDGQDLLARGEQLFARHCAVCHGEQGRGDGKASYLLHPRPRDFTQGRFRIVTTANGAPSDEDLLLVLERGMPGSAMPAWTHLSLEDRKALAAEVRALAVKGLADTYLQIAEEEEEDMTREEALELAKDRMTPGPELAALPRPSWTPAARARAADLYARNCADCHGADGRGQGVKEQWNEDGTPNQPRDFTAGIFKGSADTYQITCRIRAGMPGSPMPTATLEEEADAALLAAYVRELVRPEARGDVLVQRRRSLQAARAGQVPESPDDPAWEGVAGSDLPLMPLWWRDRRVERVRVQAVHDGRELAIRLSWQDPSAESDLLSQTSFSDAAALQLTSAEDPPLFTMGEEGAPVEIWFWKAAWELDRQRFRDIDDRFANRPDDPVVVDAASRDLYQPGTFLGNAQSRTSRPSAAEHLAAEGFGTLTTLVAGRDAVSAESRWRNGIWEVVLRRPLRGAGAMDLRPGSTVFVGFAVWDGAAGDRNGQKSVTIWHSLAIER